jgi:hypothetical protein
MSILKYALWTEESSAYHELGLMIATFGIEEVLSAIAEITKEQYWHKVIIEGDKRIVVVDGKEYVLP